MRTLVKNYTFNKVTKQVTLTDYTTIKLENVLLITDVENNTTIYQANDPTKGGSVASNVITLDYNTNTSAFSNLDKLQIFYEEENTLVFSKGSLISTLNSTSTPLAANATFTGVAEDVSDYGVIQITIRSDVASATDGLEFLFSTDNIDFYSSDEYTIGAGKFKTYSVAPVARYFKIRYKNGTSAQTQFLIQTSYKQHYTKPSSHRLADNLSSQDDAEVVQSVLVAKLPSGEFENIKTTTEGHLITDFAQNQKDAFDRLITVNATQIESFDHRITKHPDDFDEVITGSATSVLNATTASVDMTTTTGATDSVIRQTYRQFEYTRGNAQQALFSLNLNGGPKTNNNRYFGLGDGENGAFIGIDGTGFYVMYRSKTSGSVVDTKIYQSSFNQDKMDGTGKSGITLDFTKHNLFSLMYSWLGTNAIIFTVTIGGVKYPFHVETVGNKLTTAWSQSGQLPIRMVNENTGATASSTTFKVGCSSVFTYGSTVGTYETQSVSSGVTAITLTTTEKVCAGIRLRNGLKYVSIEPILYQLLAVSGTNNAYYKVILRPTLTGATWANQGEISEILTNNPTYTGGIVLQEGFLGLSTSARIAQEFPASLATTLGYSIAGVPDSLIITIRTDSGSGSIFFSGSWKEIF